MKADSSLVSCVIPSPNNSGRRIYPLTRISIHCVVGQTSVESLGYLFADPDFGASSNYGVGYDGKIGQYVTESDRSWCTSSYDNDNRAITIETASDTFEPYRVTDAAYKALIKLVVDICRRNGKKRVLWFGDKNKSLSYQPKSDEIVLTVHRWFCSYKSCPGDYLYGLHPQIAAECTKQLGGKPQVEILMKFDTLGINYKCTAGQVKTVQRILISAGYHGKDGKQLAVNGKFDADTEYAVKTFQKFQKITVDGIVGQMTWRYLTGAKIP